MIREVNQIEMICLNELIPANHVYRRFLEKWDFKKADERLTKIEKGNNYKGYGITKLFKCLLLQFMEDLSDRELERYLQENNTGKWFCGFGLTEKTPVFSLFSSVRKRIGTKILSELFANFREQLKEHGYISETFTFVDATHLIAKANLWKERDRGIKERYEKLNNETLPKIACDKQARIGCKGKNKYWYGYKQHTSVDMRSGLINKVAISPANVSDAEGLKNVCPTRGAIYADKGYCSSKARCIAAKRGCHLAAILKNNMKGKNKDKDRWYTKIRAPYERVFAHQNKRVRYRGIAKNQFSAFMNAICFNLKRLVTITTFHQIYV